MALARNHSALADGTFSATGKTNWEAGHALSGAISGGIPYFNSTTGEDSSALLAQNGVVVGGGAGAAPATNTNLTFSATGSIGSGPVLTIGSGATTSAGWILGEYASNVSGIWATSITPNTNNYAFAYVGTTGSAIVNGGNLANFALNNVTKLSVLTAEIRIPTGSSIGWTTAPDSTGNRTALSDGGTNQVVFNTGAVGGGTATSRAEINKLVASIADNTATATLTVTIPNGAHSAGGKIVLKGAAGAGGAIGADEFTALVEYDWTVTRTAGVNAVATLSAALLTAITSSVAGGATPTISAALSAISGAVGVTNTFTFNVTIHAITGSSSM